MSVLHVTSENFNEEVINSDLPVLVDFWAEWCGPCRMIGPVIEEISKDLQGTLKVAKVNVDEAQDIAGQYRIMSIPTMLLFKGGEIVTQVVGAMSKEQLLAKIKPKM
ncbi:MAG TPA: thioredoxin [Candidatus Omnitrophota bacterium]|nr:thioredoxin [Candidatus Omnitrophota bacterium]